MSSPVHRFLFSPPSSPPAGSSTSHNFANEPLTAIRDFLLPTSPDLRRDDSYTGTGFVPSPKRLSPSPQLQVPGASASVMNGFTSTRGYPSRLNRKNRPSAPLDLPPVPQTIATPLPTFQVTSPPNTLRTSYPRRHSHRRNLSLPINIPTTTPAPSTTFPHISLPKPIWRAITILAMFMMAITILTRSVNTAVLDSQGGSILGAARAELRETVVTVLPRVFPIGERRLGLHGRIHGAPKAVAYRRTGEAAAPPKAYRPAKSAIPITPEIELLALQSYLLADGLNALPPTIDPYKPLDPMMFLGFNPKDESGWRELKEEVAPLVVWDIGATWTSPIHNLLELYDLSLKPLIIPLSTRPDSPLIQSILSRLISHKTDSSHPDPRTHPLITIAGRPVDGYEELLRLHRDGELYELLERAGALIREGEEEVVRGRNVKRSRKQGKDEKKGR